jgi:hypothetical protein
MYLRGYNQLRACPNFDARYFFGGRVNMGKAKSDYMKSINLLHEVSLEIKNMDAEEIFYWRDTIDRILEENKNYLHWVSLIKYIIDNPGIVSRVINFTENELHDMRPKHPAQSHDVCKSPIRKLIKKDICSI